MKIKNGFSLIELMIVVVVMVILCASLIPNFLRFQTRAKQSEARQNLSGIYASYLAYFSDNNAYPMSSTISKGTTTYNCFNITGWEPKGTNRYLYYCMATGYFTNAVTNAMLYTTTCPNLTTVASQTGFTLSACSNLDSDAFPDEWGIDDKKRLINVCQDVKIDTGTCTPAMPSGP